MRIIAGKWGGRRLQAPAGLQTRPTSDRVKEALFSALGPVAGCRVLDLYAGTGSLGLEALSRGARETVFVEQGRDALQALRGNILGLKAASSTEVRACSVDQALARMRGAAPFDLVLVDPPYAALTSAVASLAALLQSPALVQQSAALILEHASKDASPALEGWDLLTCRTYGDTSISRYGRTPATGGASLDDR